MVSTLVRILAHIFLDTVMQIRLKIVMIENVHLEVVSIWEIILCYDTVRNKISSLCQLLKLITLQLEVVVLNYCG
jgi:hypothetical protein